MYKIVLKAIPMLRIEYEMKRTKVFILKKI